MIVSQGPPAIRSSSLPSVISMGALSMHTDTCHALLHLTANNHCLFMPCHVFGRRCILRSMILEQKLPRKNQCIDAATVSPEDCGDQGKVHRMHVVLVPTVPPQSLWRGGASGELAQILRPIPSAPRSLYWICPVAPHAFTGSPLLLRTATSP